MLVNGVKNPLAIDRDTTRFTWMSSDTTRGERQAAYQIILFQNPLGSGPGTVDSARIWWDSGKINSDQSASIEYTGKALPTMTRFWWKVRIWDQTGEPS
ncbi:MAG: hypothetical protein ACREE6_12130, partial [Limisphaerales bacterium]